MILLNGPNTPFGRMALVTALELGVEVENRVITVSTAEFLDDLNPLRQIPTLILDDGMAVFDSRVICGYFASLVPGQAFVPDGVVLASRWAMVLGLMDAAVALRMEAIRPPGERSPGALQGFERRLLRTIAALEGIADDITLDTPRMDRMASAVALDYIDFRHGGAWRDHAPRLASWLGRAMQRPSMAATRPR